MAAHKNAHLNFQNKGAFQTQIKLTGSKSECNRALILEAVSNNIVKVENISNAADSITLQSVLQSQIFDGASIDIGPAGTAMRFLTAYLCTQKGTFKLTGSERMKQRPIAILVNALRSLGAQISYLENDGFPPLQIQGDLQPLQNEIMIKGDVSSQYLSAILLCATHFPNGLKLNISGTLTSRPYVEMTLRLLEQVGITHQWENQQSIYIPHQNFKPSTIIVEPDWSAASYWYSICALSEIGTQIELLYLKKESLQGDQAIVEIMSHFGVETLFHENGITITHTENKIDKNHFDFISCPDLAQTVIVCAAALGYNLSFSGLHTLRIKETDRIFALQQELAKFNIQLIENNNIFTLDTQNKNIPKEVLIHTYEDHRMAMAFAPLAIKYNNISIEAPEVVEKSYPDFWVDLKKIGYQIDYI